MSKSVIMPNIVFGELHNNPITTQVLTSLVPKLKSLGYLRFFDEMIQGCTLEMKLKDVNSQLETFATCEKIFTIKGLNIHSAEDRHILCEEFGEEVVGSPISIENEIKKQPRLLAEKEFLLALSSHKIEYKPIDSGRNLDEEKDHGSGILLSTEKRDKEMAAAYLKEVGPIFGRNGIGHHSGIQKNIQHALPDQKAQQGFIFFQIFTQSKSNDPLAYMLGGDFSGFNVGANSFPLGLVKIDASAMTIEKVVALVLEKISEVASPVNSTSKNILTSQPALFPQAPVSKDEEAKSVNKQEIDSILSGLIERQIRLGHPIEWKVIEVDGVSCARMNLQISNSNKKWFEEKLHSFKISFVMGSKKDHVHLVIHNINPKIFLETNPSRSPPGLR